MTIATLVVPCFNEELRLDLPEFGRLLARRPEYRLVFVDDGSTDQTRRMLEAFCDETDRAQYLSLHPNQGKGAAVRAGALQALDDGTDFLGYWDADLAASLDSSEDQLNLLQNNPEASAVLGIRVGQLGHDVGQNVFRRIAGRTFARVVSKSLGVDLYDPQCGHKLFRVCRATKAAFAEPFRSRWLFDIEILARLMQHPDNEGREVAGLVRELPLRSVQMGPGSKVGLSSFVSAAGDFVTVYFNDIRAARKRR